MMTKRKKARTYNIRDKQVLVMIYSYYKKGQVQKGKTIEIFLNDIQSKEDPRLLMDTTELEKYNDKMKKGYITALVHHSLMYHTDYRNNEKVTKNLVENLINDAENILQCEVII